jgi:hypothetical protein
MSVCPKFQILIMPDKINVVSFNFTRCQHAISSCLCREIVKFAMKIILLIFLFVASL